MHTEGSNPDAFWSHRWSLLGRPLEVAPTTPVAIALSGGADSVYLATMIARSVPRPRALAIHVDHGLRGEESRTDAEFCARLCAKLGLPFARRMVEIDPEASDLEGRARQARYKALAEEAANAGISVILTGHHEDDAVETLLMRWMRGTDMQGLAGLRRETILGPGAFSAETERPLRVLRPLIGMRREEVRSALRQHGIEWREDLTNSSAAFSRNRVRSTVLPEIAAQCGDEGVENLRAFARAVESFEDELADRTAHITWDPVAHEAARRSASMPDLGGSIRRDRLGDLSPTLMKRALGRLIGEGTGQRPARHVLQNLAEDLTEGRTGRREIHEGWTVQLQSDALHLTPPSGLLSPGSGGSGGAAVAEPVAETRAAQKVSAPKVRTAERPSIDSELHPAALSTPEVVSAPKQASASGAAAPLAGSGLSLGIPGAVQLPDGRSIHATLLSSSAEFAPSVTSVEIDADGVGDLQVRFSQPGDRFRGLGAPGHKPLRRFLSDIGIPREERGNVPLVVSSATGEILWVAGVRVAEARKVQPSTKKRVKLTLEGVRER
ncbi:tRNA(Ile)-lysidine synthase [Planctomycetes bacterium Poly30]|uniref:tRNA(Ile)-lysidine synthase n=1 Tax=Saltatorellus ferox TaxID=2528018 RepID=A0A518ETP0_9BACT|nr:tRNA(Ile)-lysidine synthase [Planctomycetes bacterium Poly30]